MTQRNTTTATTSTPAAKLVPAPGVGGMLAQLFQGQAPEQGTGPVTPEQPQAPEAALDQAQDATEDAAQAQAPAQTPEQVTEDLAAALAKSQAEEEARVAALQAEADEALKECRKAFRHGQSAHRKGLLEAGRYASAFIAVRLRVGNLRATAVRIVEGRLAEITLDVVDVNRLVRVYHAWRLLTEGMDEKAAGAVPYNHIRDYWCQLVDRVPTDTAEEYRLMVGLEEECRAAFQKAVGDQLHLADIAPVVRGLQERYATLQAAAKEEAAKAARAKADAEREASLAQSKALADAKRDVETKAAAAKARADEETTAALAEAEAKLRAQQDATIKAQAQAEQAQKEARQREREEAEARKAKERAADKAAKKAQADAEAEAKRKAKEQGQDPNKANHPGVASTREQESRKRSASAQGKGVTDDPLAALAEGTAKDSAEQLVAVFECHQAPDDLLEALLKGLAHSQEMSARARRACKEALLSMHRPAPQTPGQTAVAPAPATAASPSPVALAAHLTPATNGTPAAAAK